MGRWRIGLTTRDVAYFAGMRIIVTDNISLFWWHHRRPEHRLHVLRGRIAKGVQQDPHRSRSEHPSLQDVMSVSMHYGYHLQAPATKAPTTPTTVLGTNASWELIHRRSQHRDGLPSGNSPFGGKYA